MKKINLLLGLVIMLCLISCGPSAASMAKKSCAIYEKYLNAEVTHDSIAMIKYDEEFRKMDKELTEKYMYENPEWLLNYATIRDKCMKETLEKITPATK